MREIFATSEKLKQPAHNLPKHDFPWSTIECGQSFAVQFHEMRLKTLRSLASKKSKLLGRRFKVAVHDEAYEVGRVG